MVEQDADGIGPEHGGAHASARHALFLQPSGIAPVPDDPRTWNQSGLPASYAQELVNWLGANANALIAAEKDPYAVPLFDTSSLAVDTSRLVDGAHLTLHLRNTNSQTGVRPGVPFVEVVARLTASRPVPRLGLVSGANYVVLVTDYALPSDPADVSIIDGPHTKIYAMLILAWGALASAAMSPDNMTQIILTSHPVDPANAWLQQEALSRVRFGSELILRTKPANPPGYAVRSLTLPTRSTMQFAVDGGAASICIPAGGQHYVTGGRFDASIA